MELKGYLKRKNITKKNERKMEGWEPNHPLDTGW
jgi:hypothetical protein